MPPGGETYRLYERFGENVLPHGSHEWLPYSKDDVLWKCSNNNLLSLLNSNSRFFYTQRRSGVSWKN